MAACVADAAGDADAGAVPRGVPTIVGADADDEGAGVRGIVDATPAMAAGAGGMGALATVAVACLARPTTAPSNGRPPQSQLGQATWPIKGVPH